MPFACILLGSNIGDRLSNLNTALDYISKHDIEVKKCSAVYESAAWGNKNQDDFLNAVLQIETQLKPHNLLQKLLSIEAEMGRNRGEEIWQPRIIDIDILYYNDEIIHLKTLNIPHPHIAQRKFTLMPLSEIAAQFIHPELRLTQEQLLNNCKDNGEVKKTKLQLSWNRSKVL